MPEDPSCTVLRTTEDLHALRPAWEQLWLSDPAASPFQSPAWLLPWWTQFGDGLLRVVTVHRSGSLRAVLPFYIYTEPADGRRKLFPVGIATSDYLDGSFAPDCSTGDMLAGLNCLLTEDDWDSLEMAQLRPASRLREVLRQWRPEAFHSATGELVSQVDAVPLAELPPKIRRNTRYYRARAEAVGTLELTISSPEDWPEAFDALERLHTARWNLTGEPGLLADQRVGAWHREAIPQLYAAGLVRLYCLRLNGEIIAVLYTLLDPPSRAPRTEYTYMTAFSPEHADLRPGFLLLGLVIDDAARQGFAIVDFLRGTESYKDLWHPRWIEMDSFFLSRVQGSRDSEGSPIVSFLQTSHANPERRPCLPATPMA